MRLHRVAVLLFALVLGISLFAHAAPMPQSKALTARKAIKAAKIKAPKVKAPKVKVPKAKKVKAAPVKAAKPKAAKPKSVKPKAAAKPKAVAKPKAAAKPTLATKATKVSTAKAAAKTKKAATAKVSATKAAAVKVKATKATSAKAKATKAAAPKAKATKAATTKPTKKVAAPNVKASNGKASKAATAKATKAAVPKAKATKAAASKSADAAKASVNPACSRPGANKRADCATPAAPATPAKPAAVDCAILTSCDACVASKQCKFNTKAEKCSKTGVIGAGLALPGEVAANAAQCKTFETKKKAAAAAAEKKITDQADAALRSTAGHQSIIDHIITGPKTPATSGRHLFSTWSKQAAIASTAQKNTGTQLAQLDLSSLGAGKKTVWIDGAGGYSKNDVTGMCRDAIAAVIKKEGSFKNKVGVNRSHNVVVAGPHGNVCITVNEESCFPKNTSPAGGAVGSAC